MDRTSMTFEQYSSDRLTAEAEQITAEWVGRLTTQLGVPPTRVLPHQDVLDDIPVVLRKAAAFLLTPDTEKLTSEQLVTDEMNNIALLRRTQGYTVQEILREFDELAQILDSAALRWVDDFPGDPQAGSVGRVFGRLNRVPLLMGGLTVGALEEERNELLRRLASAEEHERLRISRELHDQMGQLVTALLLGLRALSRGGTTAQRTSSIDDLEALADRIPREVQQLALELRAPALDKLGLKHALEEHVQDWSIRSGIEADFHSTGLDVERLPDAMEITVFGVVQEGLTNVAKHAGATRASVILERRGGVLGVIVEDDGQGFEPTQVLTSPEKVGRLGLRGMQERVSVLGGRWNFESAPGEGTTLYVRIPDPTAYDGERGARRA
ncbi:MAG: sensor histidine kinase [Gemmatimonadetes bacterium]|nr:sensor histidine kinase [Gemmatimonadota bacterium]